MRSVGTPQVFPLPSLFYSNQPRTRFATKESPSTMAPIESPRDLGLAKILARVAATSTQSEPPTLVARQDVATVTVVSDSGGNSAQTLSGGAIAGIVIGSIVGFLLLLWIIKSCMNLGAPPQEREKWYNHTEPPRRHRHRSRSRRRPSTSMSMPPPIIIRESRSRGSRSRSQHRGPSPGYYYGETDRGRSHY